MENYETQLEPLKHINPNWSCQNSKIQKLYKKEGKKKKKPSKQRGERERERERNRHLFFNGQNMN